MSIRPVVLNGMIQRTQDVGNLKQQEDNRPIVEQQNIQIEQQKHEDQRPIVCRIRRKRRTMAIVMMPRKRAITNMRANPAGHKKRREEEPENEGKVILKGQGSHFDIKI